MSYKDIIDVSGAPVDTGEIRAKTVFTKNTASQGARSEGYSLLHDETGKESLIIRTGSKDISHKATAITQKKDVASREHIHRLLRECRSVAKEFLETEDPIELSNEGNKLIDVLDCLWEWRRSREDNWGDLLNLLQGALKNEQLETFPHERRLALARIFEDCLTERTVTKSDFDKALQLMNRAGLDPWKGISGLVE